MRENLYNRGKYDLFKKNTNSVQIFFIFLFLGTLTVANSPSQFKPPINQPYANRLAFLATLPLNERLGYFKAQILKTGAKALTKGSNTLGRASQNLNSAAANLYSPRPVLQPLNAGRPGTGIQGRDVLRPG